MSKKKYKNFEEALKRLEEISTLLDSASISLDDSIKFYEEGVEITKFCYDKIHNAELKITELKKSLNDSVSTFDKIKTVE